MPPKKNLLVRRSSKSEGGKLLSVRLPACAEASAGRRRILDFSRGDFLAAALLRLLASDGQAGGESGSD